MVESKQQCFRLIQHCQFVKELLHCLRDGPKQPALGKHTVPLALSCIRALQGRKTPVSSLKVHHQLYPWL